MQKAAPQPSWPLKTDGLVQNTDWPIGLQPSPGHRAAAYTRTALALSS